MSCKVEEKRNTAETEEEFPENTDNTIRNTLYSVGIDQTLNLKEQIAQIHGRDSQVMNTVQELEEFLDSPDPEQEAQAKKLQKEAEDILNRSPRTTQRAKAREMIDQSDQLTAFANRPEMRTFIRRIRRRIRHPQRAEEVALELVNEGYLETLERFTHKRALSTIAFARDYAQNQGMTLPAALLFGYQGAAYQALVDWMVQEQAHGMHRYGRKPHPFLREETQAAWRTAGQTSNWPATGDDEKEKPPYEVSAVEGRLPAGIVNKLKELWRGHRCLRDYTGTNRLAGDIPYQILEDTTDLMIRGNFLPMSKNMKYRYDQIIEDANQKGMDSFLAVYRRLFPDPDQLQPYWDQARQWLYSYSLLLWETQNELWLAEGQRVPATGVVYKPAAQRKPVPPKKIPGTIYLNNGRYYWVVARKMKPRALIEEKAQKKIPGTIFLNHGRYYWMVAGQLKRQRLVPPGEKYSTQDRATAQRIAARLWTRLQIENPTLAAKIRHRRSWGTATKDRATAQRIARKMWKSIQKNDPALAVKISQDHRPRAKDHWVAQIIVDGKHRHIGTYTTRSAAEAAYVQEFENTFGYPPGYNVQSLPKLDKVWPSWSEEKTRLAQRKDHPRMPVIGPSVRTEPLKTIVERMQQVDWLVNHCLLVLDENSPSALPDITMQSQGKQWYAEIKKQGQRAVIQGTTSLDQDTERIRITLYEQGLHESQVLTEEIYHIIFEIIRRANPMIFTSIEKWYSQRLQQGLDPSWPIHEVFAARMVQEEEFPRSTDLPRRVIQYAQQAFSTAHTVPEWVMEKIKAD